MNPKSKKELTEDDIFKLEYILLLYKILLHNKTYSSIRHLSPQDKKVIEYHLKDVARNAVLANTSTDECAAIFESQINQLIQGDKVEWDNTLDLIRRHHHLLNQLTIAMLDDFFRYFTKPKRKKVTK